MPSTPPRPIPDGFPGERVVVLPRPMVSAALRRPLLGELLPTDIGHYHHAAGHERHRPKGCPQAILIACLTGRGWCELAGRRHAIAAGQLLAVPSDVAHAYGADLDDPWSISWLHLAGRQVHPWLVRLGVDARNPVRPLGRRDAFASSFDEVLSALEQGVGDPDLLLASSSAWRLLAVLATTRDPGDGDPVGRVLDLLRQRIDGTFSVAELAAVAGLSPNHFATRFRAATGRPPLDYHLRLKMARAAELLDTTDLAVQAVAERLGYADPFYFARRFRAVHGQSPSDHRARRKG